MKRWGSKSAPEPFEKDASRGRIGRILCIQTGPLVDLLLTLPSLRPLRERFPSARVSLVCSPDATAALSSHPEVDRVLPFDAANRRSRRRALAEIRHSRHDLAVAFGGASRDVEALLRRSGARHRIAASGCCRAHLLTMQPVYQGEMHLSRLYQDVLLRLGCTGPAGEVRLPYGPPEAAAERRLVRGLERPLVGVHVGAGGPLQCWAPEDFAEAASLIQRASSGTIVVTCEPGGNDAAETAAAVLPDNRTLVCSPLPPKHLQALYAQLDLLVTADPAAMHLADGVQTPVVAIFGSTSRARYAPQTDGSESVWVEAGCRKTCTGTGCSQVPFAKCLAAVSPEMVAGAAVRSLERSARWSRIFRDEAA